jgi:hypothetical protein
MEYRGHNMLLPIDNMSDEEAEKELAAACPSFRVLSPRHRAFCLNWLRLPVNPQKVVTFMPRAAQYLAQPAIVSALFDIARIAASASAIKAQAAISLLVNQLYDDIISGKRNTSNMTRDELGLLNAAAARVDPLPVPHKDGKPLRPSIGAQVNVMVNAMPAKSALLEQARVKTSPPETTAAPAAPEPMNDSTDTEF